MLPPNKQKWFDDLNLKGGCHSFDSKEYCVMEATAFIAGERHSMHPVCVAAPICSFMMRWNDAINAVPVRNQWLKPLIPVIIGTNPYLDAVDIELGLFLMGRLTRVYLPTLFGFFPELKQYAAEIQNWRVTTALGDTVLYLDNLIIIANEYFRPIARRHLGRLGVEGFLLTPIEGAMEATGCWVGFPDPRLLVALHSVRNMFQHCLSGSHNLTVADFDIFHQHNSDTVTGMADIIKQHQREGTS